MKLFDCHLHSYFSADSDASIESIITVAQAQGLAGVILTDHIDYETKPNKWDFSFEERASAIAQIQKTTDFPILQGLELGYQHEVLERMETRVAAHPWDMVILSVHMLDGVSLCKAHWSAGRPADEVVSRYLEAIFASVTKFKNYDVVGHIGYVLRYAKQCSWNDVFNRMDLVDAIFDTVIADGKGIELNTSGWRQGLESPIPHEELIRRYRERGGTIVTIGSDAHRPDDVGFGFEQGAELLARCGFESASFFKRRERIEISLMKQPIGRVKLKP